MGVTVVNIIEHSQEVINTVRRKTNRVILFYSTGKDSIALLDLLAPHFDEIVCVYMYFVKGLDHIERYINYSSAKYHNVRFITVPHWNLTYILREGLFCAPNPNIRLMTLKDVDENIRLKTGVNYSFYGMKQADSLNRRLMLRGKGYENEAICTTNKVYPLSKWSNKDVQAYLKMHQLPAPITYSNKKKSQGLGFDIDVFLYLQKNYPNDLKKILTQFPLAEQILYEHEQRKGDQ